MRRPAQARRPPPRRTAKPARRQPLVSRADVRRIIDDLASSMAPADLVELLGAEAELRRRAAELDGAHGELLRAQLDLALSCLRDHVAGACPQIPFRTVGLLAAAVAYLADEIDLIPDFVPRYGTLDDGLVMAMACQLADDGLRRYATWKGHSFAPALAPATTRARASARGRKGS